MATLPGQRVQDIPEIEPSNIHGQASAVADAPVELPAELLEAVAATAPGAAPSLVPPTESALEAATEDGIAAWHNGKKIVALWSNVSNRNAYISVEGMGWKKLSNANDSCVVSMTMMAAHAEQTNANVNIRIEADGMVHEIYVW
jgi:hypothetical protein